MVYNILMETQAKFICAAIKSFSKKTNSSRMDIGPAHAYIDVKGPFALFDDIRSGFIDRNGNFESRNDTYRHGARNLNQKGNIPVADLDLELGQKYADQYNAQQTPPTQERKLHDFSQIREYVNGVLVKE